MVTRRGTLLEKNIEKIFKLSGFETKRNYFISGYETDVYAEVGGIKIVVQCKQYESASLNVRDVIHQWDSKRKKINVDKVIVMIYGMDIKESDLSLAKELDIVLWGEKEMEDVEDISIGKNPKERLLQYLNIQKVPVIKNKKKNYIWYIVFGVLGIVFLPIIPFLGSMLLILLIIILFFKFIRKFKF